MHRAILAAASALFPLSPLLAQAGNELVFVGTSTSGSTDQHAFVASATGQVVQQGGNTFTDNVTDAVWNDTGRNLYVAQSLQNRVARAEWNGSAASWSTFWGAPGACYGLGLDPFRQRLWVLSGASGSTRELFCLDADPASATYGTVLAQTSTLSGASRERWGLSRLGNRAAVPHAFVNGGLFEVVDTDPSSPTFLQVVASTTVPGAQALGFAIAADATVSLDERYGYVLYSGIAGAGVAGGLGVYDLFLQQWLDFDPAPGQQDFVLTMPVPNKMALSFDRSFLVVSGQGGNGWAMRVDFDYTNPSNTVGTVYQGLTVPDCNGISLSPDDQRVAVTSTPVFLQTPSYVVIFDAQTGTVLQNVTLASAWNVYTTAWQDGSPTATYEPYGTGCAGSLGVPLLVADAGSRPALGASFAARVDNLPFAVAALAIGLSNTVTTTGLLLPFDLTPIGMGGCQLWADPLLLELLVGAGSSATWTWAVPQTPSLFGFQVFTQAFSLDPSANQFGFAASNGAVATLGY